MMENGKTNGKLKRIKRPDVQDIEAVVELYYTKEAIGNKDMARIFGSRGLDTVYSMKNAVRAVELERGTPIFTASKVNTRIAYEVWGIDINEMEKKLERMKALKITKK